MHIMCVKYTLLLTGGCALSFTKLTCLLYIESGNSASRMNCKRIFSRQVDGNFRQLCFKSNITLLYGHFDFKLAPQWPLSSAGFSYIIDLGS